jgi:tRNA C32,U32 (ribose-2'-O)-methylase TrmJ
MTNETSPCLIEKALKEFIHYSNQYEDTNFLEMKETIKPEIDEKNVNEYIKGYLKSRNLKKVDLKRREHMKQKEDLIRQLTKRSNLSKRKIAILIGVNWEKVRRVSEEPSP